MIRCMTFLQAVVFLHSEGAAFISGGEPVHICNALRETRAVFMRFIVLHAYYAVVNGSSNGGRMRGGEGETVTRKCVCESDEKETRRKETIKG